jgi:hypothetical protein
LGGCAIVKTWFHLQVLHRLRREFIVHAVHSTPPDKLIALISVEVFWRIKTEPDQRTLIALATAGGFNDARTSGKNQPYPEGHASTARIHPDCQ